MKRKYNISYEEKIVKNYLYTVKNNGISLNFKINNLFYSYLFLANRTFDRVNVQDGAFLIDGFEKNLNRINKHYINIPKEFKLYILKQL